MNTASVDETVSRMKNRQRRMASPGAPGVLVDFADAEDAFALAWVAAIVASLFDVL